MGRLSTLFFLILIHESCIHRSRPEFPGVLLDQASHDFLFTRPDVYDPSIRDRIVHEIDGAKESISLYCYEIDEPEILRALDRARGRKILLKIVGSPDQSYAELRESGFAFRIRARSGLQHSKVWIIDHRLLISGTGNFTQSDLFHNNNAFFFLNVSTNTAMEVDRSLENADANASPVFLPYGGVLLVSPSRGKLIQTRLFLAALNAKKTLRYMIFSHTDQVLSSAMAESAMRGVLIEGIYDAESDGLPDEGVQLNNATRAFIYTDGNRSEFQTEDGVVHGGHLHHKTMIVDDEMVLTGSYNFSIGARDSNQEAYFEFQDPAVTWLFNQEFERVVSSARLEGKPPFPTSGLPVAFESPLWCGTIRRLTVFFGSGASAGAQHFRASDSCVSANQKASESAGTARSSWMVPGQTLAIHSLSWRGNFAGSTPGIPSVKKAVSIKRATTDRLWVDSQTRYSALMAWVRDGLVNIQFQESAPGVLTFAPLPPGDAIVFLWSGGVWETACLQSGTSLDSAPSAFLQALELEGIHVSCTAIE